MTFFSMFRNAIFGVLLFLLVDFSSASLLCLKAQEEPTRKTRDVVMFPDRSAMRGRIISVSEEGTLTFFNEADGITYDLERGSYRNYFTEVLTPFQFTTGTTFNYGLIDAYRAGGSLRIGVILPNSSVEIAMAYAYYTGRQGNGFTNQLGLLVPLREKLSTQAGDISIYYLFRPFDDVTIRPNTGFGVNFVKYERFVSLSSAPLSPVVDFLEDYLELRVSLGLTLDYKLFGPLWLTAGASYIHELGSDYGLADYPQLLTYKHAVVLNGGLRFVF